MTTHFGHYRLDRDGVWRGKQAVRLTPKALAVLRTLVARAGQLVTKAELFQAVWPETSVSDSALTSCIQELRHALNDDARRPRFLETLHRRGYRFTAAVAAPEPSATETVSPAPGTPLIDRDLELAALHQALARARAGERQIVFVTGESGIGKTTLVEGFLADIADGPARSSGVIRIGRGQCVEHYGAGEAYLPVLEAFGRLCRQPGGDRALQILTRYAPTWVAQMPSLLGSAELRAIQRRAQGATRERMLRELAEAVESLTVDETLVLRLEDLHWSDASTLDWLGVVARRPDRARLLLIGTYRPVEVLARDHPLAVVKEELQLHRHCHELAPHRLDERAVEKYLRQRCPGDAETITRLARPIHARTEGNPLFMVNVVDDLIARDVLASRGDRWTLTTPPESLLIAVPTDVRQMIQRHATRLAPVSRELLEIASTVGASFSTAAVAAAGGATPAEAEDCLAGLARREQFIQAAGTEEWPDGTVAARFGFLHALYREVLYDDVPVGRRRELHARVGARLETAYGTAAADIAAALAMHFERSGDHARAVRYHHQAGTNAIRSSAPREAIAHLERAVSLLQALPEAATRDEQELAIQIALGGQLSTLHGWAAPAVERAYARARALSERVGDAAQLFPALWGLWIFSFGRGLGAEVRRIAEDMLARAERAGDIGLRLQAHHAYWATSFMRGELAEAHAHAAQGHALYDPDAHASLGALYGAHDAGVCGGIFGGWALLLLGYPVRAMRSVREAIALAARLPQPFNFAWAHMFAAFVHQSERDPARARGEAEIALAVARENAFVLVSAWATTVSGWALAVEGQADAGIAEIRAGLAAARATGSRVLESYFQAHLAEVCLAANRDPEGLAAVTDALSTVETTGERFYEAELWRLRGKLSCRAGDRTAAAADFTRAREIARQQESRWLELRALVSLTRLDGGESDAVKRDLAGVVASFTEGQETADLCEARALLEA